MNTTIWDTIITYGTKLVIVILILILARSLVKLISRYINRYTKDDSDVKLSKTQISLMKYGSKGIIYFLALVSILLTIPELKGIGATIFASVSILTIAVTYAAQATFSNLISGIFIIITKPFQIGNRIEIPNRATGVVEEISLRHTVIRSSRNQRVLIPNSVINTDTVINYDLIDMKIKNQLSLSIGYESNFEKARQIIIEAIRSHPNYYNPNQISHDTSYANDEVVVRMTNWGDSSIDLVASFWNKNNGEAYVMRCDLLETLKIEFDKEKIDIPYPHRTIINK